MVGLGFFSASKIKIVPVDFLQSGMSFCVPKEQPRDRERGEFDDFTQLLL